MESLFIKGCSPMSDTLLTRLRHEVRTVFIIRIFYYICVGVYIYTVYMFIYICIADNCFVTW